MKSRVLILILALALLIAMLTGCGADTSKVVKTSFHYQLIEIEKGGVLYLEGDCSLAPYYSPNGKLCHLVDGEIEEI